MTRSPGSQIEGYEILGVLGRGAFGITYEVRDQQLGLRLALKEFFPAAWAERDASGRVTVAGEHRRAFDAGLDQFLEEGRTLARLDHPVIARVQRHFEAEGTAYLLMPLYAGRTLHQLLVNGGTFSPEEIKALLPLLLDGLAYLESQGVVHGDIKPSNIMVTPSGEPVLLDFGAARVHRVQDSAEAPAPPADTPRHGSQGYAALEQGRPELSLGPQTDCYGLSATLYRLMTGHIPVGAEERFKAVQNGSGDPLIPLAGQSALKDFPARFLKAVDQGLQLHPGDRPGDLQAWRNGLLSLKAGRGERSGPEGSQGTGQKERVLMPQFLAAVVILGLLGAAAWLLVGSDNVDIAETEVAESSLPDTSLARDDESWEQAVRTDSAAGFRAYLQAFPQGRHVDGAREQLAAFDEQRWAAIQNSVSLDDFQSYLEDFPDGRYVIEAQGRVAVLEAAEAQAEEDRLAREARDTQAWQAALSADSLDALNDYLLNFPGGLYVAEALERKAVLERRGRDNEAWRTAQALDRKDGYEAYLKAHPDGLHLSKALAAIDRLTLDPGKTFRDCSGCPEMVVIPPGAFDQGAGENDRLARSNEKPRHQVRIPRAFAMGRKEVTFAQWELCVSEGGCRAQTIDNGWGRGNRPVILVNWVDAQAYVDWLSRKTGQIYELPSESQWEYVARDGEGGPWIGGQAARVCDVANIAGSETGFDWLHEACADPFRVGTAEAGYFAPNSMGVYDMVGNVAEWTQDCVNLSYIDAPADGSPWARGLCSSRVTRGGSWFSGSQEIRLSSRFPLRSGERNDFTGFRVVREVKE